MKSERQETPDFWRFFPEGLIAAFLVLIAPFWGIAMIVKGQVFPAIVWVGGTGFLAYQAYMLYRRGWKFAAHIAVLAILCLAWVVDSWVS